MTRAEKMLWQQFKAHRLEGFGFRRQTPIGDYIADFVSHSCRLVIEVDGESHEFQERIAADAMRDRWFASRGYAVLRFSNEDVLKNLEGVVLAVGEAARYGHPPPCPSPARGEGTPIADVSARDSLGD